MRYSRPASSMDHLHHLFLSILLLLLLLFVDPSDGAVNGNCTTFSQCGGINISYPFWSRPNDDTNDYCGYAFFGLTCINQRAVLHLPQADYNVEAIDYERSILTVTDAVVADKSCPRVGKNFTEDVLSQLALTAGNVYLRFFFNCTSADQKLLSSSPSCFGEGNKRSFVFINGKYPTTFDWFGKCEENIVAPVMGRENMSVVGTFGSLLQNGFQLNWTSVFACQPCENSGGYCGYTDRTTLVCFCDDGMHNQSCSQGDATSRRKSSSQKLFIIVASAGASIFIIAAMIIVICRIFTLEFFRKAGKRLFFPNKSGDSSCNVEEFLESYGSLAPKRYGYYEIKKMTNFFKKKLGEGGYGSVYKGKLPNGRQVAVKLLTQSKGNGQEFVNEVASIGRTYHVNIVTLLGFCSEGSKRALVYELMPNGSLEKFMFSRRQENAYPLEWEKLLQILIGIARGLDYLHRGCNMRILHFDIKPHNILLDHDFCPKISDFGLAKLCPSKDSIISMLDTRGTIGYIAPELFCRNLGGVSHKSDVYSYGMLVLEMAGGTHNRTTNLDNSSQYFPQWIYSRIELNHELGLQDVVTGEEERIVRKMIKVGLWCIQTEPPKRPSMSKVVEMLEGDIDSIEMPPKPFLSSLTSPPQESSTSSTFTSSVQFLLST